MRISGPRLATPRPATQAPPRWSVLVDGDCFVPSGDEARLHVARRPAGQSLAEFVKQQTASYPSAHTMIVSDRPAAELAGELQQKVDLIHLLGQGQRADRVFALRDRARFVTGASGPSSTAFPGQELAEMLEKSPQLSPEGLARKVVSRYALAASPDSMVATESTRLTDAAPTLRVLVKAILEEQSPRERLYTHLIRSCPMQPHQTLEAGYDDRDLGTFLRNLAEDKGLGARVNLAARQAARAVDESMVSLHEGQGRTATGLSGYLPWHEPAQLEGEFAAQTGWNQLLDYIYAGQAETASQPATETEPLGLGQRLGKAAIYEYKKYVSPYLGGSCAYDPSCSQYTREAIEEHGLIEGSKLGFMRLISCNGHGGGGHDPVPHAHDHCHEEHDHHHQPLPQLWLQPPSTPARSEPVRRLHQVLFGAAGVVGAVTGGLAGGLVGLVAGAGLGATVGWKAGSGSLPGFEAELRAKYGQHKQESFSGLTHLLTVPGSRLSGVLGSNWLSGFGGAVAGGLMGALGGAFQNGRWFAEMGKLYGQHRAMDAVGEFPTHYHTAQILARDYHESV